MRNVFDVQDPRGRRVICTEACWQKHVLAKRPWMKGWEGRVRKAIERPHFGIYQSPTHKDRQTYYRRTGRSMHLKVVVEFHEGGPGEVVTAYPIDSLTPEEVLVWPESHD